MRARWTRAMVVAVACAVAVASSLTGCSTGTRTAGAPDPALRGQWVLASGHDGYGAMNLLGQDITLTVTDGNVSSGRGSCSNYTATIYGPQRALWVTTTAPRSFACATAEQSVLQLQYLADLGSVSRSSITSTGLELTGPEVDLRYVRATHLALTPLVGRTWQLATDGILTLDGNVAMSAETGGYLRFESTTSLSGVTRCVYYTADYRQVADELVTSHVLAINTLGCDLSSDRAAQDFSRLFDGGFTFALDHTSLEVRSSRAGLALGFTELGTS